VLRGVLSLIALSSSLLVACSASDHAQPAAGADRPLFYRNPMDPSITSPTPAKDSMGMDYVPVYASTSASGRGDVQLSPGQLQRLGVRTSAAQYGRLPSQIIAPGIIRFDQRSSRVISAPLGGWVQQLSVKSAGDAVRSGQVLFELYSPLLTTADEQYLRALRPDGHALDNPYALGLRSLGLNDEQIGAIAEKRRAAGHIPFTARSPGVVEEIGVAEGAYVAQGTPVIRLVGTDPVWGVVELAEGAGPAPRAGAAASVSSSAYPDRNFDAHVDYVYPSVDPATRTLRVRLVLQNPDGLLKDGMYVSARIDAGDSDPVVYVPREAVIRGGRTDQVILSLGDGRFSPREVKVGRESGESLAILSGLETGQQVVTGGTFLIDSEANLHAALTRLSTP